MEALILVCALSVAAADCKTDTSVHSFYAPQPYTNPAGCMREGMMFAAQSNLVMPGTYPKIVCGKPRAHSQRTAKKLAAQ